MKNFNTTMMALAMVALMGTTAFATSPSTILGDVNTNTNTNNNNNSAKSNSEANSSSKSNSESNSKSNSESNSSVKNSGNSSSNSSVKNSGNSNNHNSSTSKATGGTSSASTGDTSANTGAVTNEQNYRAAASGASAPALTSGNDTCMGSTSAGGQGVAFGFSLGSTWKDEDCVRRKDATFLQNVGQPTLALAVMCQSKDVADAINSVGTPAQKALCGKVAPVAAASKKAAVKKTNDDQFSHLNR